MYGLIFDIVRDYVCVNVGMDAWIALANKSEIPIDLNLHEVFPEAKFENLVKAACEAMKKPRDEILEIAGVHFIVWLKKSEYLHILDIGGSNLSDILQNVNSLHAHMKLGYFATMEPPQFFTTRVKEWSLYLHYAPGNPQRQGLGPLVIGIVKGLCEHILHLDPSKVKITQDKHRSKGAPFDVWHINWKRAAHGKQDTPVMKAINKVSIGLSPQQLDAAFPFHIVVNRNTMKLEQFGSMIMKITGLREGDDFFTVFQVHKPILKSNSLRNMVAQSRGQWVLSHVGAARIRIVFRYQLLVDDLHLIFVGSPQFDSIQSATKMGVTMSDCAPHDNTSESLFLRNGLARKNTARVETGGESSDSEAVFDELSEAGPTGGSMLFSPTGGNLTTMGVCPFRSLSNPVMKDSPTAVARRTAPGAHNSDMDINPLLRAGFGCTGTPPDVSRRGYPLATSANTPMMYPPLAPPPAHMHADLFRAAQPDVIEGAVLQDATKDDFEAVLALLEAVADSVVFSEMVISLCRIYNDNGHLLDFFLAILEKECTRKNNERRNVFREDSVYSSIIVAFMKGTCNLAVRPAVRPLLDAVSSEPAGELASERACALLRDFISRLVGTVHMWPNVLKLLFRTIMLRIGECGRFPVIALLILRYIAPCILFPEKFMITMQDANADRGRLLTVSKLLQSISNQPSKVEGGDLQVVARSLGDFLDKLLDYGNENLTDPLVFNQPTTFKNILGTQLKLVWNLSQVNPSVENFIKHIVHSATK
mmetsp:Transcript_34199/g.85852  ORF Transcript_34199/g.85852 Transcript_34199/m.85852 type:complete len:761 (-) Transcript_34199:207-2489(-)|eukprot:CAMPEP_0177655932 /NCGR_PEP_ID=MMETSP0447-20121125/15259_1 /TAXON_ID=0 /ORGANISM="Stygamoeba regulata, Strain BSH-02190019" /LENGTH=760 /DNA_ID=CAMNT_0019159941 /DNA_START=150 /DNA_END=2432 /DNA_ORIENTATION=+